MSIMACVTKQGEWPAERAVLVARLLLQNVVADAMHRPPH